MASDGTAEPKNPRKEAETRWEFADAALKSLIRDGRFTYSQLDQIRHLHPRVKLSLARNIALEKGGTIDFRKILHPTARRDHKNGCRLYRSLFTLARIFVTTNYDEWLDEQILEPTPVASPAKSPMGTPPADPLQVKYKVDDLLPSLLLLRESLEAKVISTRAKWITDLRKAANRGPLKSDAFKFLKALVREGLPGAKEIMEKCRAMTPEEEKQARAAERRAMFASAVRNHIARIKQAAEQGPLPWRDIQILKAFARGKCAEAKELLQKYSKVSL